MHGMSVCCTDSIWQSVSHGPLISSVWSSCGKDGILQQLTIFTASHGNDYYHNVHCCSGHVTLHEVVVSSFHGHSVALTVSHHLMAPQPPLSNVLLLE